MNSSNLSDRRSENKPGSSDFDPEVIAVCFGDPFPCAGNQPLQLGSAETVHIVEQGCVDVFAAEHGDARFPFGFKHLVRAEPGQLLFGHSTDGALRLIAKGLPNSYVRSASISELLRRYPKCAPHMRCQADIWIQAVAEAVVCDISPRPHADKLLTPGDKTKASGTISAESGIVWIEGHDVPAAYLGIAESASAQPRFSMPVSPGTWVSLLRHGEIHALSSADLPIQELLLERLPEFMRLAMEVESLNRILNNVDDANLQREGSVWRRKDKAVSRSRLFSVFRQSGNETDEVPQTLAAFRVLGRHEGFDVRFPSSLEGQNDLHALLQASRLRVRQVRLRKEDHWWRGDSGAMIAYRKHDGQAVALLRGRFGAYRCVDPLSGESKRASAGVAEELGEYAMRIYRPLPIDRRASASDLLRLAGHNQGRDIVRVILAGAAVGAVSLAPAAALGLLAEILAPSSEPGQLVHLTIALILLAFLAGMLNMIRGTAMMRIEGRASTGIVAAIWDRLLRLRTSFYRRFTAGDLATRALTFLYIRDTFSAVASEAVLSVIFLVPTFILAFAINTELGWVSLILGTLCISLILFMCYLQIDHHRRKLDAFRMLAGHIFQIISGIAKLRVAGAESSAYASWARLYRAQKLAEVGISRINEHLIALAVSFLPLWSTAIFAVALTQYPDNLSVGEFMVVYAASMIFVAATANLCFSAEAVSGIIPAGEQSQEITDALPEAKSQAGAMISLNGEFLLDRVSFRYADSGPLTVENITIRARPGEFIAIVGQSASGKSTIMRLALGLEAPLSGTVYYDGRNLSQLNIESLRHQVGAVMQENALQNGTILDNIIGTDNNLTADDAWRAARQAAVADEIEALPMGMHTQIGGVGSVFSGGQLQRIRIAAALVRRPAVVFLDEATGWLDSKSQTATMEGIEKTSATRIIIAHRISTIRKASRIYVMQTGKVVQEGSFEQLRQQDGLFRSLAERQSL